ncbi:MAG: glycosyltransferase family 4 protein [Candidatus Aenigmarchaeota archaeon]|nr:glycosyltransferase family 4 protein [Candidatus Aenigmarchaeota archaeon]
MRILHVVQHFWPCSGGVEVYLYELCRELIRRGHTSDVACFDTCVYDVRKLPRRELVEGINIYRFPYINLKYYKMSFAVLKLLKVYDVIHIHTLGFFSDLLVLTKPLHGKPLVLSTHGAMFHTSKFSLPKSVYFYGWDRLVLKGIDRTIAVSRNDQEMFSKITRNMDFIPIALHIRQYSGLKREPRRHTFLHIGRLARNKGIGNLLKTMASLKAHMPDFRLYVVGDDWMGIRKGFERMARELGIGANVIFCGRVSEKEKLSLLAKAQFFVSSSEYEGFGISVVEAMAAGMPVIANNIEAFRNFITHGKNGFLVDFSKPEETASFMRGIAGKDLSRISAAAKSMAGEYDWGEVIKRVEAVYEASAGGKA